MKIGVFGQKRIPSREGGVEVVAEELAVRMARMGHQITCYNRTGKQGQYRGVTLKTVAAWNHKGLAAVTASFSAAVLSALSSADVVHIHAEGPVFFCWLPKLFGKRVVVTVHGLDWRRAKWKGGFGAKFIRAGEKMAVRYADEIIVLSANVQDYFEKTYGRHTIWIPNGVTKPEIAEPQQIRRQFGLEKDGYILFLGRLVPEKGVHYLIEAYRNVKTDIKLVIAGAASDTEDYVERLKIKAEPDERIVFTGFVQGQVLAELYSNAWVYVLPSDVEGMPLSLLEAMSYGNCCLVSDIPECTEVVEDRGLTFPKGDISALGGCLQRLCSDPAVVAQYRETAREFICEKYNWDDVAVKTLELYR